MAGSLQAANRSKARRGRRRCSASCQSSVAGCFLGTWIDPSARAHGDAVKCREKIGRTRALRINQWSDVVNYLTQMRISICITRRETVEKETKGTPQIGEGRRARAWCLRRRRRRRRRLFALCCAAAATPGEDALCCSSIELRRPRRRVTAAAAPHAARLRRGTPRRGRWRRRQPDRRLPPRPLPPARPPPRRDRPGPGYSMAPIIRYGLSSFSNDKSWPCGCGRLNGPTRHLIFMLPKHFCDCGKKFNGDFRISFDDIRVNGHNILGKIHCQIKKRCVAYAFVHALQIKERLEAIIMKRDPSLLEDLDPEKLFNMYEKWRSEMIDMGCATKPIDNVRMVHIGLILKEDGLKGQSDELDNVHTVGDVTVIAKNDFEGITTALAEGASLVTTFYSGKRLCCLKYGQIYKSYRASEYRNQNKKIVGHGVCLIGAGWENGEEYYDVVNSHKDFCVRRDAEGNILKFGVGRIRASDLKCNVIRLSRAAADGEDDCRLQPQTEIVLNDHNRHLMTRLKV